MTIPQSNAPEFFGLREAADYLTEQCGRDTSHTSLIYDINQGRIKPLYLSDRFLVLSRAQLDDYAERGETPITVPEGLLVTKEQAAQGAGTTARNIRRIIEKGDYPFFKIGDKWVIEAVYVPRLAEYIRQAKPGNVPGSKRKK